MKVTMSRYNPRKGERRDSRSNFSLSPASMLDGQSWTSLPDLYAFLRLPIIAPITLEQKWIKPAIKDSWTAAGIPSDIKLRRAATVRQPGGKVRDVVVMLQMPEPARAIVDHEPTPSRWQTPPKFAKPRPAAPPTNVVPLFTHDLADGPVPCSPWRFRAAGKSARRQVMAKSTSDKIRHVVGAIRELLRASVP